MRVVARLLPIVVALCALVVVPSSASAYAFIVTSTGDQTDTNTAVPTCDNGMGQCTLRAALAQIAFDGGASNTVVVDLPMSSVITVATTLTIPANTLVEGCVIAPSPRPCVTIEGAVSTGAVFAVNSANAALSNVAIANSEPAFSAINLGTSANGFRLWASWIGMRATGEAVPTSIGVIVRGTNNQIGSLIDDTLGNVFANVDDSIQIVGADSTGIFSNKIGTNAAGIAANQDAFATTGGSIGISIERDGMNIPDNTNIGGALQPSAIATSACDGGCNVIGRMSQAAIDLDTINGAPGTTFVRSNYIGVGADGVSDIANAASIGIDAGSTSDLTVGGDSDARNVIAGGDYGIRKLGVTGVMNVDGNVIGFAADETTVRPPVTFGVYSPAPNTGVGGNRITAHPSTGYGVWLEGGSSAVSGNVMGLAKGGAAAPMRGAIYLVGNGNRAGLDTFGNTICGSTANAAITIAGGDTNIVQGNRLGVDEAGTACTGARANFSGVLVRRVMAEIPNSNSIGGVDSDRNTISNSVGDAITITGATNTNAVYNLGADNGGLMVDIGGYATAPDTGDGRGNPDLDNSNIRTGVISSATTLQITGSNAFPAARIFVFATNAAAGGAPNGVTQLLGTTQASGNGLGTWTFTPSSPLPNGTKVVAMAREEPSNGTGEFTDVSAVADATPPDTTLTSAPSGTVRFGSFAFDAPGEAGHTFECRVDNGEFAACANPYVSGVLASGTHQFQVRAVDAAGNRDFSPAGAQFTVDQTAPATSILSIHTKPSKTKRVKVAFDAAGEMGATFTCSVDGAAAVACSSPFTTPALADGTHTVTVIAADALGNVAAAGATARIVVDTVVPKVSVVGKSIAVTATGAVKVKVTCAKAERNGPCTGTLKLVSAAKLGAKKMTFATIKIKVVAGTSVTVKGKVAAGPLATLKARGTVKLAIAITAADAAGNTKKSTQKATLVAKR